MTKYVHHVSKKPMPDISLTGVKSSQVKEIGWDPATKTLAVTFTRGKGHVYHYAGIDKDAFEAFKKAESIGSHFGKHFKSLPFEKYVPHTE